MDESEKTKYREAADEVWELSKKYYGSQVGEDLKTLATELHLKAVGRQSFLPPAH